MTEETRETRDEPVADEPRLSDEERHRRMREGVNNLLSGLLGIEPPPPPEVKARQDLREAVDHDECHRTCQMATLVLTRADGKDVLITTTFLRDDVPVEQMESLEGYVTEVARPALLPDERLTIFLSDFSPAFFAEHATRKLEITDLAEHVAGLRTEASRQAAIAKYEMCQECDKVPCEGRVMEPPEGYDPDKGRQVHADCDHTH